MHRLPELLLLTSCHHLLPAHGVIPGMGHTEQWEGELSPPFILGERKEQRGARN